MWIIPAAILLVTAACAIPLGRAMARVMDAPLGRAERWLDTGPQSWKGYCLSMLGFNGAMFVVGFVVLACQAALPLNPDGRGTPAATMTFHTTVSFFANNSQQHYAGEVHLSYLSQLIVIVWNMFMGGGTSLCALTAVIRGLRGDANLGNFYVDLWRGVGCVFVPLSLVVAVALVACGVPMTLDGAEKVTTLDGAEQTIARGPVAALVPIKNLASVGGGFFGTNSAHPFENPNAFANFVQCVSMLLLPAACVVMFGRMLKRPREAAMLGGVMCVLLIAMFASAMTAEARCNSALAGLPVASDGVNFEGKELRFGPHAGATYAAITTAVSCGSVNCMHDSLHPLTGLVCLSGMWTGCVFGGVGVGLIHLLLYVVVAVFLGGLMVGRTPEYLGRKLEAREMKLAMLALLIHPLLILVPSAVFAGTGWARGSASNPGPHGLTQTVYEFTSAASGNGSGFEGLRDTCGSAAETPARYGSHWDIAAGLVILFGRFVPIIATMALASSIGQKPATPRTVGTLRTDTLTFGGVLLAVVLMFGAILYLPIAALGPLAEHFGPNAFAR